MDKINYAEKVSNFNLITGNQDQEIAYKYLSQNGWDETAAVQIFNQETKILEQKIMRILQSQERKNKMKPKHINIYPEYKIDSINSIFNKISSYFKEDNTKHFFRFSKIKNAIQLLDNFILQLKNTTKTGIIIIYSINQMRLIIDEFKKILNEPLSKELFFDNSLIYPVIDNSLEGNNFIKELEITKLPVFIICKYKNEQSLAIIGKIETPLNLSDFRDKILESEQAYYQANKKNQNKKNNNINNINKKEEENKNSGINDDENNKGKYIPDYRDYQFEDDDNIDFLYNLPENSNIKMSDGQLLAIQELKLRELEKVEERKQLEKEKMIEENNIINQEIEESKKIAENLKPEPEDDNPDKCIILFRFPDGEKSVQRKFLKQDKINSLYEYIKSLGREIFTENYNHHFSLLQTFPYKLFDDKKDNTLEEEGLFPNSVLQIKENE